MLKILFTSLIVLASVNITNQSVSKYINLEYSPNVGDNITTTYSAIQPQQCVNSSGSRLQAWVTPDFPGVFCQNSCWIGYCCEIVPYDEL